MDVWFSDTGRVTVVRLSGELDIAHTKQLRRSLLEATEAQRLVILDVAELTFIDSAAIGVVVGAHRRMTEKGGEVLVINPSSGTRRVFKLLGLGWLLRDPAQALVLAERDERWQPQAAWPIGSP